MNLRSLVVRPEYSLPLSCLRSCCDQSLECESCDQMLGASCQRDGAFAEGTQQRGWVYSSKASHD